MLNSIVSLFVSFLFISSCNNETKTETADQDKTLTASKDTVPANKPANDADENGCKTSAGEQWSMIRKSCLQLAEVGIKLDPQEGAQDKVKPAWLVFSDDQVRVEIFLPTQKKSIVIRKTSAATDPPKWSSGPLTLSETSGVFTLDDEGKILYKGSSAK